MKVFLKFKYLVLNPNDSSDGQRSGCVRELERRH
jgi:hypothetical protein